MTPKFLAKQLGNPSGLIGKLVMAPIWNKRNAKLNDVTFDRLALSPCDRVLEVGFGGGYLMGRMAGVVTDGFLAGVDVSPAMVAFCEKRHRSLVKEGKLELKCASAESLPYPSDCFTKACSVNSLFYWQNAPQAISELWRVIRDGGVVVLCFTCQECLETKQFARHGVALYGADDVRQMMELSGFHDVRLTRSSDRHREFWCAVGRK